VDAEASRTDEPGAAPDLDSETRAQIAEIVGLGGIKYADLHHNRESDYIFSWSKMLAKTGDTATYMQYAYARTRGIVRKSGLSDDELASAEAPLRLSAPAERRLGLQLCRFAEALTAAAQEYRPNMLTQYLFELANDFSTFYDECAVLKEPSTDVRLSRLKLTQLTGRMIRQGLALLGIGVCERM
jgi:arginyl-tRNA synthetase